jgi:PAT family beta-lactamase induction signal transducer AmpG
LSAIGAGSGTPDESSLPAPWIIGATLLPFGLVIGFTITALPYLLTKSGISVDRVAGVSATVLSPTFWGFLLNPLLDSGFTRRTHCWITLTAAAICLPVGLWMLALRHLGVATAFMLLAELAIVLFASAVTGWIAEFVPEADRGPAGAWINVANLGGGALGSLAIMSFAARFDARWLGLGMMLAILLGATPLLFLPPARPSSFHLRQAFSSAVKATWEVCKRRESLTGFALFLAPASTAAAINLFSGLGEDFHTAPGTVIVVTGAGCALSASLGSLLGGILCSRYSRGYVYLVAGFAAGLCALAMAFLPHQRSTYIWGVLLYNGLAGIMYASFTALGLELVGNRNPVASTQLGLFAAATSGAIDYMTWADGQGYRHFGIRGLLCVDGIAAVAAAIPLLFLVHHQLRAREVKQEVQTA